MEKLGFGQRWISLVIQCDSTVSYFMLVNVTLGEGLSSLINHFEEKGDIKGLKILKDSPSINHMLFTYGCLNFYRVSIQEWENIALLLHQYKLSSG